MKTDLQPQFVTDERGKKIAVIVKMSVYKDLVEDMHDLSVLGKRRNMHGKNIPFETIKKRFSK